MIDNQYIVEVRQEPQERNKKVFKKLDTFYFFTNLRIAENQKPPSNFGSMEVIKRD